MSHVDGLKESVGLEETLGLPDGLDESDGLEEILGALDGRFSLVPPPQAQHASLAVTPALAYSSADSPQASGKVFVINAIKAIAIVKRIVDAIQMVTQFFDEGKNKVVVG